MIRAFSSRSLMRRSSSFASSDALATLFGCVTYRSSPRRVKNQSTVNGGHRDLQGQRLRYAIGCTTSSWKGQDKIGSTVTKHHAVTLRAGRQTILLPVSQVDLNRYVALDRPSVRVPIGAFIRFDVATATMDQSHNRALCVKQIQHAVDNRTVAILATACYEKTQSVLARPGPLHDPDRTVQPTRS